MYDTLVYSYLNSYLYCVEITLVLSVCSSLIIYIWISCNNKLDLFRAFVLSVFIK
jgi:hypothetical protein